MSTDTLTTFTPKVVGGRCEDRFRFARLAVFEVLRLSETIGYN